MSNGISMQGNVFINVDARVSDLLNDSSVAFLSFKSENGSTRLLNKFEILRLIPFGHKR